MDDRTEQKTENGPSGGSRSGLTERQWTAVNSNEPLICVTAGPGSGKTRTLVQRVITRVLDHRLELTRTLALTFTENAAAQMKQKLAEAFEERGLEQLRRELETVYISTIHSFCSRLLRENAVDAGVDPDFQVLDLEADAENQRIVDELFDAWLAEEPETFAEFIRHFKKTDYAELLVDLYDRIRGLGADPSDAGALLRPGKSVAEVIGELQSQLPALSTPKPAGRQQKITQVEACLAAAAGDSSNATTLIAAVEGAKAAIYRAHGEDLKAFREELERLRRGAFDVLSAPQRRTVVELLGRFHRAYGERKTALSALDFEDLERTTLEMLRNSPQLLQRTRARFDEILVDEYQDTSPLQDAIIQLLAEGRRLFVVGDPAQSIYGFRSADPSLFLKLCERAKPDEGRIDLRQDFRSRAEVIGAVNAHFSRTFDETGTPFQALTPGSEFDAKPRASVELLLTACEEDMGLGDARPGEAARIAARLRELVEPSKGAAPLSITLKEKQRPVNYGDIAVLFRSTSDIRIYEQALEDAGIPYFSETGRGFYHAQEVRDVINVLRVLDNSRHQVAVAGVLRSPMFAVSDDALFLLARAAHERQGGSLSDVIEEPPLWPAELPSRDAEALRRYCATVHRLRERRPWLALAALIREIIAITAYGTTLLLMPNGRRKLANVQKLAELAASLESSGSSASLSEFIAAVDRFRFEQVREGEAQLDAASEKAVRLLTMHGAKGLEFKLVVLPDLSRAPNPIRDYLDFHPDFGVGVQYNLAAPLEPVDIVKPQILKSIRERLDVDEKAERERVLFVGFTRAEEHLVLSACVKPDRKAVLAAEHGLKAICATFGVETLIANGEWHETSVSDGNSRFDFAWVVAPPPPESLAIRDEPVAQRYRSALDMGLSLGLPVDMKIEEQVASVVAAVERPLPPPDRTDFIASATDITLWHGCPRRYYLGRYLGYQAPGAASESVRERFAPEADGNDEEVDGEPKVSPGDDESEVNRRDFGIAVHGFLGGDARALERLPQQQQTEAAELIKRFQGSEYGKRLSTGEVRRELPVMAKLGDRFLYGILDVLQFENGAPSLLLDYKTDRVGNLRAGTPADPGRARTPALQKAGLGLRASADTSDTVGELTGHYRAQMLVYARLIEAAFGARPREAVLYFLAPGVPQPVELSDEAMAEAEGLLEKFFEAQRACSFPAQPGDQCRRCEFNSNLCMAACV